MIRWQRAWLLREVNPSDDAGSGAARTKWYLGVILYCWWIGTEVAGQKYESRLWRPCSISQLIKHLNASLCGPLAWTAAQNKEIESHLDQGCRAELT